MKAPRAGHNQRGSTLLVAMILLLIFAIMAAASFRGSLTSVQAIGNMQWRSEAITAANDALDRLLSSADFATKTVVVTQQVNAAPFQVDINGDGVNDIATNLPVVTVDGVARAGPRCLRAEPIPSIDLDPTLAADLGCFGTSGSSSPGLEIETSGGASTTVTQSPSLCSNTEWTITVRAADAVTRTSVDVVQGVGVRVLTTAVPVCN
ncbi:MAG: pilus assembly PilX N-terminal domain-containing protein [Pseudomonadota bacterium]